MTKKRGNCPRCEGMGSGPLFDESIETCQFCTNGFMSKVQFLEWKEYMSHYNKIRTKYNKTKIEVEFVKNMKEVRERNIINFNGMEIEGNFSKEELKQMAKEMAVAAREQLQESRHPLDKKLYRWGKD